MVDFAAAVVTTILFTVLFAYFMVSLDIEEIKADWANRRCDVGVMVAAMACKPAEDPRTGLQFAMENFKFCTGQIATQTLKQAFAPLYSLAGQEIQVLKNMSGPINSLRNMVKTARETFEGFLGSLFSRFSIASWLLQRTNMHFQFAFGRVQAIFYSVLYLGLSLTTLITNQLDFTVEAIKIFLGILAGLLPILIIPLAPFIDMINKSMDQLEEANYGGGMDSARSAFCVDPDALARMADGTLKPLKALRIGDVLESKSGSKTINSVTGILEAEAFMTPLVTIDGVKMSGTHRVLWRDEWILANEHPLAIASTDVLPKLICLNTTEHVVPIQAPLCSSILFVGDWEEVSTEEGRQGWIKLVSDILQAERPPTLFPKSVPLLGPGVQVRIRDDRRPIPITEVRLGDYVRSGNGLWTRVVGIYRGAITTSWETQSPDWMSDGIWMENVRGVWALRSGGEKHDNDGYSTNEGYHLVTEAEIFEVLHQGHYIVVRDFTEMGASRLESSYEMLDYYINKK
jgi:hypothetical protein